MKSKSVQLDPADEGVMRQVTGLLVKLTFRLEHAPAWVRARGSAFL